MRTSEVISVLIIQRRPPPQQPSAPRGQRGIHGIHAAAPGALHFFLRNDGARPALPHHLRDHFLKGAYDPRGGQGFLVLSPCTDAEGLQRLRKPPATSCRD